MPLSAAEQKELAELEAEFEQPEQGQELSPAEKEELRSLEQELESEQLEQPGMLDTALSYLPEEAPSFREGEKGAMLASQAITKSELESIKEAYKLSPEQYKTLEEAVEWHGGMPEGVDDRPLGELLKSAGKGLAGRAGKVFGFGVPQKLYRMSQDDPKMEEALDALDKTIREKQSYLMDVFDLFGGATAVGKAATKLPAATGIATAESVSQAKAGEETKAAGTAVALSGALAGAGKVIGKGYTKLKDWSEDAIRSNKKATTEAANNVGRKVEALVEKEAQHLDEVAEVLSRTRGKLNLKNVEEFKKSLPTKDIRKFLKEDQRTFKEALENARKYRSLIEDVSEQKLGNLRQREGGEFIKKALREGYYRDEFIKEFNAAKLGQRRHPIGSIGRAVMAISDGKPAARIIDDQLGTKMSTVLDDGAVRSNIYTNELQTAANMVKDTYDATKHIKNEDLYRLLDSKPSKADSSEIKAWRELFENGRNWMVKRGIPIKQLVREGETLGYIPKLRLPMTKYVPAFRKQLAKYQVTDDLSQEQFEKLLGNDGFQELVGELQRVSRKEIKDAGDFMLVKNTFLDNPAEVRSGLNHTSFATKYRDDRIPEWALETDVPSLAQRWFRTNLKHAAVRDTVQELKTIAKIAEDAGEDQIHNYTVGLIQDILGTRVGTPASALKKMGEKIKIRNAHRIADSTNPVEKRLLEAQSYAPDIGARMMQEVYPAYIGLNPKSMLQNLTSFYLQNTPEIGFAHGTKLAKQAIGDLASEKDITKYVISKGYLPRQWTAESIQATKDGFLKNKAAREFVKWDDKYQNAMMYLFNKSEIAARYLTDRMGRRLADDMIENPKIARSFLTRMTDSARQRQFERLLKAGDQEGLRDSVAKYLNDSNMFNYDKLNMSEYGRVMGPMFSVFSKWPTATAGKVAHQIMSRSKTEAATKIGQMLVMPWLTLNLADNLMKEYREESPRLQKVIGRDGLATWAQLDSMPSPDITGRGGLMETPAVKAGKQAGQMAQNIADGDKFWKSAGRFAKNFSFSFVPGAGLARFMFKDIPLYVTGRKPD